jgi:hypothetical protein
MKTFALWLLTVALAAGQGILMEGKTAYFQKDVSNWRSGDTRGTVVAWIKIADAIEDFSWFASADVATDNQYIYCRQAAATGQRYPNLQSRGTTFNNMSTTNTTPFVAEPNFSHVAWVSTGSGYVVYVNGKVEPISFSVGSNDGAWMGNATGRDNVSIGRLSRKSPGLANGGILFALRVYSRPLTAQEVLTDYNSRGANFSRVGLVYASGLPNGYATGNTIPNAALLADRSGGGLQLVSVSGATPATVVGTRLRRQNKRSM